ncbi:MAG: hypothetical protein ACHQRJ_07135 [Alphaproteobacteria bacterium]
MSLPEVVAALISDAGTMLDVAGSSAVGSAVAGYLRKRRKIARDILLEELRAGAVDPAFVAHEDEVIGVLFHYRRAAEEGAARVNLRLLAKAIVGEYRNGRLVADKFMYFANMLAELSQDEIIVIGTMYKHAHGAASKSSGDEDLHTGAWGATWKELVASGMNGKDVLAAANRALRSGLLIAMSTVSMVSFEVSSLLSEIGTTIDFQDAIRREQGHMDNKMS